jgi:hypothetical protein
MTKKLSSSPERHTFQADGYVKRCEEEGKEPNEDYLDLFKSYRQQDEERMVDPAWQKDNLEYDLRSTDWILEKVRSSDVYAQNLYAAICNNDFQRNDVYPILANKTWACSWRSAGGIIANMQQKGDYIDWYCSGIKGPDSELGHAEFTALSEDQQKYYLESKAHVSEGVVTQEIKDDLFELGWIVLTENEDNAI